MALLCSATVSMYSCANQADTKTEEGTHTHDDGSTHSNHDTVKPAQQEFNAADTTAAPADTTHSHDDGKPHTH